MNNSDSSEEYFSADDEEKIKPRKGSNRRSLQGGGKGKQADAENASAALVDDRFIVDTVSEEMRLKPQESWDLSTSATALRVTHCGAQDIASSAPDSKTTQQEGTVVSDISETSPVHTSAGHGEEFISPGLQSEETPPKPPPRKKKKKKRDQDKEKSPLLGSDVVSPLYTNNFETKKTGLDIDTSCTLPVVFSVSSSTNLTTSLSDVATAAVAPTVTVASVAPTSIPVMAANQDPAAARPPKPPRKHQQQVVGISIEHDIQLELTADMMCGSEVVTADTLLAKASGGEVDSNMAAVFIPSDDESIDGESLMVAESNTDSVAKGGAAKVDHTSTRDSVGSTSTMMAPEDVKSSSPSDTQILQMTMVKNLDTGEVIPLSAAEERIPRGWSNPLAEHLKQRTSELEGSGTGQLDEGEDASGKRKPPITKKLKKIFKWKEEEQQVLSDDENEEHLKYKSFSHHKGPYEFDKVRLKQDLSGQHLGAVWVMEFSICGKLLATAGQDSVVRVWVLRTAYSFFHELQAKYQRMGVHSSGDSISEKCSVASTNSSKSSEEDDPNCTKPFLDHPLCSYYGHTADVLGMSWSKNFFILSSSMDKTVRLWHISRKECLCCFQHVDFVTAIAFHPRDDRYFLSGSLDGKLRLWNIPDKKVALWNEIEGVGSHLITAANFCADGKFAVAGTYDGRCIFYDTEHLKYHTQIHVRSRHGKNRGRKISGVEPLPGENKVLVTSNDSRIRLYNLVDHSLTCKYKGGINTNSQIKATFSRDGQYIISGSEDKYIYIWKTHNDVSKLPSARRDRNELYESFSCHSAPVTAAIFAPVPGITVDEGLSEVGHIIVAADYQGCIKVYVTGDVL